AGGRGRGGRRGRAGSGDLHRRGDEDGERGAYASRRADHGAVGRTGPVSEDRPGDLHRRRRLAHAVQENSDVESPVLPSYSMPKALMRERFASAIVRLEPAGWNMPWNRIGSPVSIPNGTMSSISKSIASPTRTL